MGPNTDLYNRSIAELEGNSYDELSSSEYPLLIRIYSYVHTPLSKLSPEALRTLISQKIGLQFVVPLALDILDKDILAEAEMYPGDLLETLIRLDLKFWTSHRELHVRMDDLITANIELLADEAIELGKFSFPLDL